MLTQYRLLLSCESPFPPRAEWAYRLYAVLLDLAPPGFGELAHLDTRKPLRQHLRLRADGSLLWTVNLLGDVGEAALSGPLERLKCIPLDAQTTLRVRDLRLRRVRDLEDLLALAQAEPSVHRLLFCTPTAFKSQKRYQTQPTARLVLQSLIRSWNACVPAPPLLEEEGKALDELAADLLLRDPQLRDRSYFLKGSTIPGCTGSILLENRLEGDRRLRTDALLLFSEFSGVGIKTALGMGGVERRPG